MWVMSSSWQQWTPGRVGRGKVQIKRPHVAPGDIDRMQARLAGSAGGDAGEHHDAAVGRPGRTFVEKGFGQRLLTRAVDAHDADVETLADALGEGDHVALRRPRRR